MTDHQSRNRIVGLVVVVVAALLVGASLTVAGQQTQGGQAQDTSYLRVVHASPDAPAVDVYLNNQRTLAGVPFGTISDYRSLPAGSYNVTITAAGNRDAVVFDGNVTVEPREAYTVAATGEVSEDAATAFEPVVVRDNAIAPEEGTAVVSVVHLVPDAPTVDLTVAGTNTVVADNVSFREASDYVTVPAGDYTLQIRRATADDNGTVITAVSASVEGGEAYSALAVGYLGPETAPADTPFDVILTQDATTTIELPDAADENEVEEPTPTTGNG